MSSRLNAPRSMTLNCQGLTGASYSMTRLSGVISLWYMPFPCTQVSGLWSVPGLWRLVLGAQSIRGLQSSDRQCNVCAGTKANSFPSDASAEAPDQWAPAAHCAKSGNMLTKGRWYAPSLLGKGMITAATRLPSCPRAVGPPSPVTNQSRDLVEAAHQQDADGLQTIGCQQVQLL